MVTILTRTLFIAAPGLARQTRSAVRIIAAFPPLGIVMETKIAMTDRTSQKINAKRRIALASEICSPVTMEIASPEYTCVMETMIA